jgi:hypothetical protein
MNMDYEFLRSSRWLHIATMSVLTGMERRYSRLNFEPWCVWVCVCVCVCVCNFSTYLCLDGSMWVMADTVRRHVLGQCIAGSYRQVGEQGGYLQYCLHFALYLRFI